MENAPSPFKERRTYVFACRSCGAEKAQSFKRSRARKAVCQKCRRAAPDARQASIFGESKDVAINQTQYVAESMGEGRAAASEDREPVPAGGGGGEVA